MALYSILILSALLLVNHSRAHTYQDPHIADIIWDATLLHRSVVLDPLGDVASNAWPRRRRRTQEQGGAEGCDAGSKLWFMESNSTSKGAFFFGSYHYDYKLAWPLLPLNNRLALHSCDAVYTEIDFNDKTIVDNYDSCTLFVGAQLFATVSLSPAVVQVCYCEATYTTGLNIGP